VQGTLRKLSAWLLLVAYALSGVSPAQRFVVCLEPDGSIALEAAASIGCAPSCGEDESSPESSEAASRCCPCIDIPLPTRGEEPQSKARASEVPGLAAVVLPPPCLPSIAQAAPAGLERSAPVEPRPSPGLALLRTVVLRV
jgi:hypothetical protein